MTDEPGVPAPASTPAPVQAVPPDSPSGMSVSRPLALGVAGLAAVGVLASALLWLKLSTIQEHLARQSAESTAQALEARTLARQASDAAREAAARQAVMETRLSEVALQRTQLEELMQSLSRSRDENLVVDIDSALRLAQQQAQLTGSVQPLLAALKTADQRLLRAAQPRLNPLQRAIARDIERVKAATVTDTLNLLTRIDELTRLIEDLPLANAVGPAMASAPAVRPASPASAPGWWVGLMERMGAETRKLVRVGRVERPEAALLSPEQSFFLRENLKLRLLNARLALLGRQVEPARADLATAGEALSRYFDASSRRTQAAVTLLQQLQSQARTMELPRVDETLAALATAAAGR